MHIHTLSGVIKSTLKAAQETRSMDIFRNQQGKSKTKQNKTKGKHQGEIVTVIGGTEVAGGVRGRSGVSCPASLAGAGDSSSTTLGT